MSESPGELVETQRPRSSPPHWALQVGFWYQTMNYWHSKYLVYKAFDFLEVKWAGIMGGIFIEKIWAKTRLSMWRGRGWQRRLFLKRYCKLRVEGSGKGRHGSKKKPTLWEKKNLHVQSKACIQEEVEEMGWRRVKGIMWHSEIHPGWCGIAINLYMEDIIRFAS